MADISFSLPTEIKFGLDTVNRLGSLLEPLGERVLLVTEGILYEGKIIDRVQALLEKKGAQHIIFDEVVPNATSTAADEGVNLARGAHADIIVGLGGVRTLSMAKLIAMVTPSRSTVDDYLSGMQPQGEPLPCVSIPTTCRDPFLLLDEYLITDARDRMVRIGRTQRGIVRAAIVDPKLTVTIPAKFSATTLLDTLMCAVEGLISSRCNYLSDTFFLRAIELIGKILPRLVDQPDDLRVRINASMAGLITALGLTMSKAGIGAALTYAINGRFMVPKSWISSVLLPHVMEFNTATATEKLAMVARLLGEEVEEVDTTEAAGMAVEAIRRILGTLGLPSRLRDFDLELDDMVEVAGMARSFDMMNYLPRPISTEDLYELIKTAF